MEGAIFASGRRRGAAVLGRMCAGLAALCALAASPALAQTTATAESQVLIQEPLTVYAVQDMDFGQILPGDTPGTVTLDPADQTCTVTGPLVRTGPCRAAIFSGYTVAVFWGLSFISIDAPDSVVLTGPGGANMLVDQVEFADDTNLTPFFGAYLVGDPDGLFQLRYGGVLHVGADQQPGEYTGTITVSIAYN